VGAAARRQRQALNRAADQDNATWPPVLTPIPVPPHLAERMRNPAVQGWRSSRFLVQKYIDSTSAGNFVRLSVQRVEHAAFLPFAWLNGGTS
jgi:hypothetical protein